MTSILKISILCIGFCCIGMKMHAQDTALARKYFELGKVLQHKKKYDESIDNYNSAIKNNPKYGEAYVYKSMVYLFKKDKVKELECLNKAIEVEPVLSNYGSRANAYAYHKEYRNQLADLNIILTKKPGDAYYLSQRGSCNLNLKDNEAALYDFKLAAAKSDQSSDFVKLANVYYELKKYTLANENIDKAIEKWTPGFFSSEKEIDYMDKGKILIALDSSQQAINYLSQYIEKVFLFRDNVVFRYRSIAYCNIGDKDKAAKDAEMYKKMGGNKVLPFCNKSSTAGKKAKADN